MRITLAMLQAGKQLFKASQYTKDDQYLNEEDENETWDVYNPDYGQFDEDDDEFYYTSIEADHPFGNKILEKDKIKESKDILDESIHLIVDYVNSLKTNLKRFLKTSANELEENNDLITSIKEMISKENDLDIKLAINEPTISFEEIEESMDGVKEFVDNADAMRQILAYQNKKSASPYFLEFISKINSINNSFLKIINSKIEQFDGMDLIKKFDAPKTSRRVRPKGWFSNFSKDNPYNTYTGELDNEDFFDEK